MKLRVYYGLVLLGGFLTIGRGAETIHVAADAKVGGNGSYWKPYASIVEARDAIRRARARGGTGEWHVKLGVGEFVLKEPVVFEPQDSGSVDAAVVYEGREGRTTVTGGLRIDGWQEREGIWEAPLPKMPDGTRAWFEMLYVNGRRAVRARHPNSGFLVPQSVRQEVGTNATTRVEYGVDFLQGKSEELELLTQVPAEELRYGQVVVHHNWDTTRRILLGFEVESGTLRTQGGKWKPWNPWRLSSQYYLENVRTAFDQAGEWFYDGVNGKVLYRPLPGERLPGTRGGSEVVAPLPGLQSLVVLKGSPGSGEFVENIHFKGICFECSDSPRRSDQVSKSGIAPEILGAVDKPGPTQFEPMQAAARTEAAIMADGAKGIVITGCEVRHTGEYAIWFRSGCVSNRIVRCALEDLGAGGVRLGDPSGRGLSITSNSVVTAMNNYSTAYNIIDNCIIRGGGRFHASATAVWVGHAHDNQVTHNEICDHYYTGISVGWVWGYRGSVAQRNLIAYNRIHKLGQRALGDMGGIYLLGTSFGTKVCHNVIFDVDSYTYGGWGLYPDEGSEGITFENNLVYDTKDGSFHQHYGRDNIVSNNILAYSRECQVAITRAEPHRSATFINNIIFWELPGEGLASKRYGNSGKAMTEWRGNLWWCVNGAVSFGTQDFAAWQASGRDVDGAVLDPHFVNPQGRDFRLSEHSPACGLGFKQFDLSRAGIYGSRKWIRRSKLAE